MTAALSPAIAAQIQSLCEAIAADPDIVAARQDAEAFLANEQAVALYRDVITLGRNLEQQHRSGLEIDEEEITRFQGLQSKADADDRIQAFTAAQDVLQEVATHVNSFVTKTLEKGRVPSIDEVFGSGGSCGTGCGCHS
ncbi:MAG: YlbF family regulator [Prosthecobacter sp.]|nr:YlbF family regulator [Prosthecobacter sp.]